MVETAKFNTKNDAVNVHILNGNAEDTLKECHEFEEKITQAGGVDLFIGGKCLLLVVKGQVTLYLTKFSLFWLKGLDLMVT